MENKKAKNGLSITQNVRDLLAKFPETRENDKVLYAYYWALIDEVDFNSFDSFLESFVNATQPATISRSRQRINYEAKENQERYLPRDESVITRRLEKGYFVRKKLNSIFKGGK